MNFGVLLTSKTFWTGIATIGTGIFSLVSGHDLQTGVMSILGGLGMIFIRDAIAK
jgi:hypothetical protein